ncbi:hypothetical protein [Nocardioides sp.]|uniref:hypothetical protein n=1 Tax=Nocardioides sp. TaxID=35761 RepID=UPI0035AFAC0A
MPTEQARPARLVLATCVATVLLLGGCADGSAPEDSPAAGAPSGGADDGTSSGSGGAAGKSGQSGKAGRSGKPGKAGATSESSSGTTADPDSESSPTPENGGGSDPSGTVLEVPVAAETTVDSLGELLGDTDRALVTAPLPRAASARGRLVGGFPTVLRPAPGSRVDTSSVSPADDRLQVALVGSTSLAPAKVLLAYRTRLARRGLLEQATPQTAAGSQAAALRRGRSVVTITVTRQGTRTSYSVIASLHTGSE